MANVQDADLILRLYEARREPVMRAARRYLMLEFQPQSWAELEEVLDRRGSPEQEAWRQVTSYWEMAAAFVLRNALDEDLFVDSNTEPFYLLAKFGSYRAEYRRAMREELMPLTTELTERNAAAQAKVEGFRARIAARQVVEV